MAFQLGYPPASPTAPNDDDFSLFPPYPESLSLASSFSIPGAYADQIFAPTSFDSYAAQNAYTLRQTSDAYHFSGDHSISHPEVHLPAQSPAYSPANSTAHSFDLHPPILSSTSDSGASAQSTISSAMASPSTSGHHVIDDRYNFERLSKGPSLVHQDFFPDIYSHEGFKTDVDATSEKPYGCVDPSLIDPYAHVPFTSASLPDISAIHSPPKSYAQPPSPATSQTPFRSPVRSTSGPIRMTGKQDHGWQPYQIVPFHARRQSVLSERSHHSQSSIDSSDENKGICPIPSCRRQIKDLKAHMLTHQTERPEKCPIPSCEYHMKGFARKYDKNRHTLTHYKGTMVCGFCPGSGSASEKSFNRADVFKRHLTTVHGVEQTAPNSRRKSPEAGRQSLGMVGVAGDCSTCNTTFPNAQEFYEHLDDCVLRVVQQADPSEAINERLLTSVAQDAPVKETLERHLLSSSLDSTEPTNFDENEEDEDSKALIKTEAPRTAPNMLSTLSQGLASHAGGGTTTVNGENRARKGLTYSKGGVNPSGGSASASGKGNKRRRNYPPCWGSAPDKMQVKKRVLCVYTGPRRLWKDDMMLGAEHQVRMPLPGGDGRNWVTDLDVQTLRRAEGLHGATEEEMGPWLGDLGHEVEFSQLVGAA